MTIAIAAILQESNTFSPVKTHYEDFSPVFGSEALERHRGKATEMGGFIDVLSAARVPVAPVCAAWAITAGRMVRRDFDRLAGEFEEGLARVRRPTALLIAMHGAQTAEGVDDVEGALLARARQVLGKGCAHRGHPRSARQRHPRHGGKRHRSRGVSHVPPR